MDDWARRGVDDKASVVGTMEWGEAWMTGRDEA